MHNGLINAKIQKFSNVNNHRTRCKNSEIQQCEQSQNSLSKINGTKSVPSEILKYVVPASAALSRSVLQCHSCQGQEHALALPITPPTKTEHQWMPATKATERQWRQKGLDEALAVDRCKTQKQI